MLIYPKHVVLSRDISLRCHSRFTFPVLTRRDYRNAVLTLLRPVVRGKIDLKNISTLLICRVYCRKASERICYYTTTFYWVLFHPRVLNSFSDSTSNLFKLALRTQTSNAAVMRIRGVTSGDAVYKCSTSPNKTSSPSSESTRNNKACFPSCPFFHFLFFRSVAMQQVGLLRTVIPSCD